tara:strand:- start:365 stop:730 length:366 start_codon:yes stop_codon:yes gene_type:complete
MGGMIIRFEKKYLSEDKMRTIIDGVSLDIICRDSGGTPINFECDHTLEKKKSFITAQGHINFYRSKYDLPNACEVVNTCKSQVSKTEVIFSTSKTDEEIQGEKIIQALIGFYGSSYKCEVN